jgi:sensor histidine kinase YesM
MVRFYDFALYLSSLELNQAGLFLSFDISLNYTITMMPLFTLRLAKKFTGYFYLLPKIITLPFAFVRSGSFLKKFFRSFHLCVSLPFSLLNRLTLKNMMGFLVFRFFPLFFFSLPRQFYAFVGFLCWFSNGSEILVSLFLSTSFSRFSVLPQQKKWCSLNFLLLPTIP